MIKWKGLVADEPSYTIIYEKQKDTDFTLLLPGDVITYKGDKYVVTEETMEAEPDDGFSYHLYFKKYKEENEDES